MLRDWIAAGTGIACVTRADRVLMATAEGLWEAITPRQVAQNPVGAGDALMAGLIDGWRLSLPPAEALRRACAVAVSSVLSMDPGSFAQSDYDAVLPRIGVAQKA
jgi:tagatose 6-phosphate kinase